MWDKKIYYHIKPFIPRRVQVQLRRMRTLWKLNRCADVWPIDIKAAHPPQGWAGWPDGKRFALVLTHEGDSQLYVMDKDGSDLRPH